MIAAAGQVDTAPILIGGWALRSYVPLRQTGDIDFLVSSPRLLSSVLWRERGPTRMYVEVVEGDSEDPLLGVVRISPRPGSRFPLEMIIPKGRWVAPLVERCVVADRWIDLEGQRVRLAPPGELILTKLYSGDCRKTRLDVAALLGRPDGREIAAHVDKWIHTMPEEERQLWEKLRPDVPGPAGPSLTPS